MYALTIYARKPDRVTNRSTVPQTDNSAGIVPGIVLIVLTGIGVHLAKHWVNFPFIDDYQTIVDFLINTKSDSLARFFGYSIWQPHNEHRIVFTRLVATAYAYLSPDGIRFDVLSASALLFRGLIVWSLYRQWRLLPAGALTPTHWSVIGFAVIILVITSGRDMENLVWATCALQNIPVVAWALLAFGAASRNRWTAAWLLGILATLTSGNGIFVLVVLSSERLINRRWVVGGVAMTLSVGVYVLYRSGMNLPIDVHQLPTLIPKFLAFQGSFFFLHYYLQEYGVAYTLTAVLVGLLYTAVGLETMWRYWQGKISVFYPAVFAFVWLTALPVALLRPGVLESRFAIYSILLTAIVYARLTEYVLLSRPNWLRIMHPVALIAAGLFFVQSYIVHDRTVQRQYRTSLAGYYTFRHTDSHHNPRQPVNQLQQAGLFSTASIDRMTKEVFEHLSPAYPQPALLDTYEGGYYFIRTTSPCNFLLLKQGGNQIALPTDTHEDVPSHTTFLMPSWLPAGTYRVEMVNDAGSWPTNLCVHNAKEQLHASRTVR